MVLKTTSMPKSASEETEKLGEVRLDAEGKGYFHKFDKKVESKEVVETPVEEVTEESTEEVAEIPKKSKSRKYRK